MFNENVYREKFKNHIATLSDYGNIKVLDFKAPDTSIYRIRFLFEEDYYRLHISGDLGNLTATNYHNMCYNEFKDFVNNIGYFKQKIDCCDRDIYVYDEETARKELTEYLTEHGYLDEILNDNYVELNESNEVTLEHFYDKVFADFSEQTGLSSSAYDILYDYVTDAYTDLCDIGKVDTDILDIYMLAFKMTQEYLNNH